MGLLLALTLFGGSPYPVAITVFSLGVMSVVFLFTERRGRGLVFLLGSLAVFVLVGSVKIIPAVAWMQEVTRDFSGRVEGYSFAAFFQSLINPMVNMSYFTPELFSTKNPLSEKNRIPSLPQKRPKGRESKESANETASPPASIHTPEAA